MSEAEDTLEQIREIVAEQSNERIRELEQRIQELEGEAERDWTGLCVPREATNRAGAPVPRLELRALRDESGGGWHRTTWEYVLIYKHFSQVIENDADKVTEIMLGHTDVSGGSGKAPIRDGRIAGPFRDGAHICHDRDHLGLPAFLVCEDLVQAVTWSARERP